MDSEAPPRRASLLTCSGWLTVAEPHLDGLLVQPRSLEAIHSIARRFLGAPSVLEVRLGRGHTRTDFSIALSEAAQISQLPSRLASAPRAFLERWGRFRGSDPISALWLEFDLEDTRNRLLNPVICARLRSPTSQSWLLEEFLPSFPGAIGRRQIRLVRSCLEALPSDVKLLYVFSLLPRASEAIRLELYAETWGWIPDYLRQVAHPGAAQQVTGALELVAECDRFHLSFDLGAAVGSRIGIEASFRKLPHREPGWARLFGRLVTADLCTPEKHDAVLAWPGQISRRTAGDRWPPGATGALARCLSHVKLVTRGDRPMTAKAYLLFQHVEPPVGSPAAPVTPRSP